MKQEHGLSLLICRVGKHYLGVRLPMVERVEQAVKVQPVPDSPPGLCGVINVRGEVFPVLDPRPGLGLESRPVEPEDHLVLIRALSGETFHPAALLVDETLGVSEAPGQHSSTDENEGRAELVAGMNPGDEVLVVGDRLVIVREDGVLVPPWVREVMASAAEKSSANAGSETGSPESGTSGASDKNL